MVRYDSEHKQRTQERVLAAAGQAIRSDGPLLIGVADVMARAGLTHGGFYAHFRSKDDLIAAAIERMFAESRAMLAALGGNPDPAAALVGYIDRYLSARHRDSRIAGCPLPFLSADAPRLPDPARACFGAGLAALTGDLAALLREVGLSEPDLEARSMLAELVGALSLARSEPDRDRSDSILAASRRLLKRRLDLEEPS